MTLKLKPGHRLDCHQTYGRLLDTGTVPDKTWVALIIDNRTGQAVVTSSPSSTRAEALADAEAKYTRHNAIGR